MSLYGDFTTAEGSLGIYGETINLYGRTISGNKNGTGIRNPEFNAYGGRLSVFYICLSREINDYGLQVERTADWECLN